MRKVLRQEGGGSGAEITESEGRAGVESGAFLRERSSFFATATTFPRGGSYNPLILIKSVCERERERETERERTDALIIRIIHVGMRISKNERNPAQVPSGEVSPSHYL